MQRVAVTLLAVCASIATLPQAIAADRATTTELPPSQITQQNYDRINARKNEITEQEVIALLGPPNLIRRRASRDHDYVMIWEHRTFIEVELKNDRVHTISAGFSPYVPSKSVTFGNFKALRPGMTEDDVREILGTPTGADSSLGPRSSDDAEVTAWEAIHAISLELKDEKVVGLLMVRSIEE